MAHPQLAPPAVVLFDRTAEQSFNNSNLTATGRDYINVSVNVGTAGAGYPFPSTSQVSQGLANSPTPPLQDPKRSVHRLSILARIFRMFRRLRHRYEKRPQTTAQTLSEPERAPQVPTLVLPQDDPISSSTQSLSPPLLETPSPDSHALSHPSSILAFDRCCQSSQPRLNVSSEEEVYERCLLPKGQGYPLFNPQPLRYPVKPGDFGILGQDGFDPIGNLFDPIDQQQFKINRPPKHEVTRQPRKLKEGQTIATGIEDARKVADHCDKANQGAVLALTSSGELETLTQKSRNQLREYLCNHGTQLMANLHREHYLEHGQSLYVVTGTIKSGCWAIAVHTSPMREPYDQVVLTRREDKSGDAFPTYDWTVRGSADARSGASDCINAGAERTKDQCLFLRGFLVTPSLDFEVKTNPGGGSSAGGSSSNLDSSSNEEPYHRKGGSASQGKGKDPDWDNGDASSGSSQALQFQSKRALDTRSLVQPFPALRLDVKSHYPSRRINEMLIQNHENTSMAITHDDDWRHIMRNDYFDDNALSTLVLLRLSLSHLWVLGIWALSTTNTLQLTMLKGRELYRVKRKYWISSGSATQASSISKLIRISFHFGTSALIAQCQGFRKLMRYLLHLS
ncbi:hypothetical protein BKA70DRAFT_1234381 [Coprinopsis sp. MPI-PUGE-AT-0042]|nr:hypothetical protein BKA70DRAFT_1234381 [Coprinopsis sp. MPI-PUGE-AT-0042]